MYTPGCGIRDMKTQMAVDSSSLVSVARIWPTSVASLQSVSKWARASDNLMVTIGRGGTLLARVRWIFVLKASLTGLPSCDEALISCSNGMQENEGFLLAFKGKVSCSNASRIDRRKCKRFSIAFFNSGEMFAVSLYERASSSKVCISATDTLGKSSR